MGTQHVCSQQSEEHEANASEFNSVRVNNALQEQTSNPEGTKNLLKSKRTTDPYDPPGWQTKATPHETPKSRTGSFARQVWARFMLTTSRLGRNLAQESVIGFPVMRGKGVIVSDA